MNNNKKLDIVIVEAIKSIVASTNNEVKHNVNNYVITKGLRQKAIARETVINITIKENL